MVANMAAEVKPRQQHPPGEEKHCSVRKSSKKIRTAGSRSRGNGQADKNEEEYGVRTSVFQGKVKALKEKHMKDRKETRIKEDEGIRKTNNEDALVSPQLRTYLTEDILDCNKQGRYARVHQDSCRNNELWGTSSSNGSSDTHSQIPEKNSKVCPQERPHSPSNDSRVPESTTERDSLSLAERVEKNRQELRSKFGKAAGHGGEISPSDVPTSKSWIISSEADGEVEVTVAEDCGELSARHEQAKQLLQRARMKAKGASPLRASHCVLAHPHSQPTLHRGPTISGPVIDGGSLSDSSSSEYSSWHKGSRGSSPSHVRFQDESEREAEERYRERQQAPPKVSTPPLKRQSNGSVSWTEQVSPSGHGQCGSCGSYIKGTTSSPAATHGTNLRNVHLGSKMSQDGSSNCPLGVKPSPHWILPSQPWRMYTELIRETHIGSDSTPDSSGEDDGNRSQNRKNREWGMQRSSRNSSATEQGAKKHPSNQSSQSEPKVGRSRGEQHNGNGTSGIRSENRGLSHSNHHGRKTSEVNQDVGNAAGSYCLDSMRTGLRKSPHNTESKPNRKHRHPALEIEQNLSIKDGLNVDSPERNYRVDFTDSRTPVMQCIPQVISPPITSGHVPVPPSGKAPIIMPSRNRLALRPGGISQQSHNSREGAMIQSSYDKKEPQSKQVPNIKETTQTSHGTSDGHQRSVHGMMSTEHKSREQTQKSKHTENKKSKENGGFIKHQEPREMERPYASGRQKDYDRHPSFSDQTDTDHGSANPFREKSRTHHPKREEKCTENSGLNGPSSASDNTNTGSSESGQCSRENSFQCQTGDLEMSTKDRNQEPADEGLPAAKKGDIRSGMKKIFSSIGFSSRPKLERFQSSSMEHISSPDHLGGFTSAHGDTESCDGSVRPGKIKKSPSLQSLKLMSPFHLPRKASSVQNLLAKSDRSAVYIADVNTAPRRALSVEDIGSPGKARVLGKVAEVYLDGTRLLQLQRPESGSFGFRISSGSGRPDSGIYVQEMSDPDTAKLYSGLLRVGDEVLEVNGTKVSILGQSRLAELMNREPVLSLRVLHQRRLSVKCAESEM